jgi:hypothetical protein
MDRPGDSNIRRLDHLGPSNAPLQASHPVAPQEWGVAQSLETIHKKWLSRSLTSVHAKVRRTENDLTGASMFNILELLMLPFAELWSSAMLISGVSFSLT